MSLYTELHRIASGVVGGLAEDDVRDHVGRLVDAKFTQPEFRRLVVDHVIEYARGMAREATVRSERAAMRDRLGDRARGLSDEAVARMLDDEKWARDIGHVGDLRPGSLSDANMCNDCEPCRSAGKARAVAARLEADASQRLADGLRNAFNDYESAIRDRLWTEWTDELLASEIAMPDGVRTTWGEATVEQHRARRDMLAINAVATGVAAARHSEAMETIERFGARSLNDVLSAARALVA